MKLIRKVVYQNRIKGRRKIKKLMLRSIVATHTKDDDSNSDDNEQMRAENFINLMQKRNLLRARLATN